MTVPTLNNNANVNKYSQFKSIVLNTKIFKTNKTNKKYNTVTNKLEAFQKSLIQKHSWNKVAAFEENQVKYCKKKNKELPKLGFPKESSGELSRSLQFRHNLKQGCHPTRIKQNNRR